MNEKIGAKESASNPKEKSPQRWKQILDQFNLTPEKWRKIYDFQKGLCAICQKPMRIPQTDHCHLSGLVRGLLCANCNRALGKFRDNLVLLVAAVEYITHPTVEQALGEKVFGMPGRINTKKQRKLIAKKKELTKP